MKILRLRDVMDVKGISNNSLAEKVGVTSQTISNVVRHKNFPKPELLIAISEALDVDVRDLFISTKNKQDLFIKDDSGYKKIGELLDNGNG